MSEKPTEPEDAATSEEVTRLYSQARLPGTRYWDFSASRKEVQGQFRDRIEREHAERAGVGPLTASTRPPAEPIRAAQFQPFPEPAPQPGFDPDDNSQPPPRSVPVLAPDSGTPSPAGQVAHHASPPAASPHAASPHDASAPSNNGRPPLSPAVGLPLPAEPVSTRWYALQSVFAPVPLITTPPILSPARLAQHPPVVVVFSLVGGVGKTCLVATLGRTLSALGEQVLLADTAGGGLLPFYFGSGASKPGVVRTFSPPSCSPFASIRAENHVPVQLLNLQAEHLPRYDSGQDLLLDKLLHDGRAASRILIDVATASRELNHRLLAMEPVVLVPILPDMNSMASLPLLESSLPQQTANGGELKIFYLLNQFDVSSALHRDMHELLHLRLGDRLLPSVLRSSSAVTEALADGMTVMDYAPESAIAEDYRSLAGWLGRIAAPAMAARGNRWREC